MMILKLNTLIESHALFKEAFTHSSIDSDTDFERLEFLGDSLIGAFITEKLFKLYPDKSEGDLSRWRSAIVSQETMCEIAQDYEISKHLISKNKELEANNRIKASLVESYLGALFIELGRDLFQKETEFLFNKYLLNAKTLFEEQDPKTVLQESAQEIYRITPHYKLIEKRGEGAGSVFRVGVCFKEKIVAEGQGSSIKSAEKNAAKKVLLNKSLLEGVKSL